MAMIAFIKPVSNGVRVPTLFICKCSTKWRFLQMFAVIASWVRYNIIELVAACYYMRRLSPPIPHH